MINTRINNLRSQLKKSQAALILSEVNRLYFSMFSSSAGAILVTENRAVFLTDFRYFEKACREVDDLEVILSQNLYGDIKEILKKEGINSLLLETDYVNLKQYSMLLSQFEGITVLNDNRLSLIIDEMRSIKTEAEITLIKEAQKITDKAFLEILNFIDCNKTEKEIALQLEFYMRRNGCDAASFDFIVVSGKNSSLPHGTPTDKKIEYGDFITMDFGGVIGGYHSDMTRTVALGSVSEKQALVYNTVLKAQETALEKIKPLAVCKDIDNAARTVINSAGFEGTFGHGLGHSVGLEIHESPCFNTKDDTKLLSGMVLTVEPGIYLKNEFGVRIEDMVAITEKDYVNLTLSPKELIIL